MSKFPEFKITKFQALFIKLLRVRYNGSWRWVSAKWCDRYDNKLPFNGEMSYGGNQIHGLMLCQEAQELLNEKTEEGWN